MSDQTLTLSPGTYDKLGVLHCGVPSEGLVTCAGEVREIADGETLTMDRTGVKVSRSGSEYTFAREARAAA